MRARSLSLILLAFCLLASGCGGDAKKKAGSGASVTAPPATTTPAPAGTTTSSGPDATIRAYFRALAGRNGDRACSLLTGDAQRKAVATVGAAKKKKFSSCGQALRAVVEPNSASSDVQITKTTVDGDRASVAVERGASAFQLRRLRGRWYIAGPVG